MPTTISPVLHYADLDKGVAYLKETFGFEEKNVFRDDAGKPVYAEMVLDGYCLGVGPTSGEDSVFDLGPTAIYVSLTDPDAMHERAAGAGAEIVMPLVDQEYGSREFACRDYENNVWCFGTYQPGAE